MERINNILITTLLFLSLTINCWAVSSDEARSFIGKQVEINFNLRLKNIIKPTTIQGLVIDVIFVTALEDYYMELETEDLNSPLLVSCRSIKYIIRKPD